MPDLVRNDLVFGRLLHKSDALALCSLIHFVQRCTFKQDFACSSAMRCKHGFQLAEQRGFTAAGRAAKYDKLALPYGQRKIIDGFCFLFRIGKA